MDARTAVTTGFFTLLGTMVVNRFLNERNLRLLDSNQKAQLVERLSRQRSVSTYITAASAAVLVVLALYGGGSGRDWFPFALTGYLALAIGLQLWILRRVLDLDLPAEYLRRFRFQALTAQIGNTLSMLCFLWAVVAGAS